MENFEDNFAEFYKEQIEKGIKTEELIRLSMSGVMAASVSVGIPRDILKQIYNLYTHAIDSIYDEREMK